MVMPSMVNRGGGGPCDAELVGSLAGRSSVSDRIGQQYAMHVLAVSAGTESDVCKWG